MNIYWLFCGLLRWILTNIRPVLLATVVSSKETLYLFGKRITVMTVSFSLKIFYAIHTIHNVKKSSQPNVYILMYVPPYMYIYMYAHIYIHILKHASTYLLNLRCCCMLPLISVIARDNNGGNSCHTTTLKIPTPLPCQFWIQQINHSTTTTKSAKCVSVLGNKCWWWF